MIDPAALAGRFRAVGLERSGGWVLVALLAADVAMVTRSTDVPNGSGIPYWGVWLVAVALALAATLLGAMRRAASDTSPEPVGQS